jgi:DNA-binding transcriptional LysR family regulator
MDQIQAIRVFARVVEAGTFTKAAESLDLPKATVTKLVQQLEARLKVKLLNRTTRRVTVTADGAAYYERTTRVLNDLDDIEASMTNAQAKPSGHLRVDVGTSVAHELVIPSLFDFYCRYPDIQLDLGVTDRSVDLLVDNVDCVIRGGELLDQSLVARRVANVPLVAVASPAYLQAHGTPTHPEQLEADHAVVNRFSTRTGRHYPNGFEKEGQLLEISGRYKLALNESNAITTAALAGLGIAQLPSFTAEPLIQRGELVQVLREWAGPTIPLHVVYPPNRHLSAKVRAFVEWTAELFGNNPLLNAEGR